MGDDVTSGMMKSVMHYRSKELNKRSAFPAKDVGKSQKDAWNHERVYFDRYAKGDGCTTFRAEFLLPMRVTPLDFAQAEDFMSALTDEERTFLDDLIAGYTNMTKQDIVTLSSCHSLWGDEKLMLRKEFSSLSFFEITQSLFRAVTSN